MISVHEAEKLSLKGIAAFLHASEEIHFLGENRPQVYAWMETVLRQQQYVQQGRRARGLLRRYLEKMTGRSRAQVTRLIARYQAQGTVETVSYRRHRFAQRYTRADIELLAAVDEAHDTLSGPATRRILQREYQQYGKPEYERLASISVAHLYNLRRQQRYRERRLTYDKTKPTRVSIGERRRPIPQGRPGYLRVDTVHQIAGPALRIGPPPLADAHPRGLGLVIPQTAFAIALLAAQIVQVGHRDARQPLILRLAVLLVFALQNAPCGRSAERVVGLVDGGQQFDVGPRVALRKAVPPIAHRFHRALGLIAGNQARHLRPAAPGHLLQVTAQQTARPAALLHVLLLAQHRLHPGIDLLPVFAKKVDFFAGVEKRRDPFQTQLLCFVHADHPSSACLHSSGSSCVRN